MGPGIALLTAGGITAVGQIARGRPPSPRILIGSAIAGGLLIGLGRSSPELASRFGTLVLLTAALTSGADVALAISRLLGTAPTEQETTA
jgi:hypothetical protein